MIGTYDVNFGKKIEDAVELIKPQFDIDEKTLTKIIRLALLSSMATEQELQEQKKKESTCKLLIRKYLW